MAEGAEGASESTDLRSITNEMEDAFSKRVRGTHKNPRCSFMSHALREVCAWRKSERSSRSKNGKQ